MGQIEMPKKDEQVCANCKHLAWLIALGLGLRCVYKHDPLKAPPIVPSTRHTCDKFESRHTHEE